MPGVLSVSAGSVGDDDLPFGQDVLYVSVAMSPDASADQVVDVLDELDRELDQDEIETIEVRMSHPLTRLTIGGDLHDLDELAGDLVAAHGDGEVLLYERDPSQVSLRLTTADFDSVVAAADRYGDAGHPDSVSVVAGRFELERARADPDPGLTADRTAFVQRVDDEVGLSGAVVSSNGPLELWTDWEHRDTVRAFLAADPEADGLGPVVVRTHGIPGE